MIKLEQVIDKLEKFKKDDIEYNLKNAYIKSLKDEDFKALTSKLNLPSNELMKYTSKLNKTVEQLKKCKTCKNLVTCKNEIPGFIYYPEELNGKLIFSYIACKHKRKMLKNTEYLKNVSAFDIPEEIKEAKMKNIFLDDKRRIEVIKFLKDFILNYDKNTKQKGLYLHGSFGGGKTYLVAAAFNELAKKDVDSVIVYFPELLRKLKASFNKEEGSFDELFDKIKKTSLLLLDDIGAENTTSWGRDEILGPILQYRMQQHLATFFTSNLSLEDLEIHYSITKESIDKVKSRRIIERIKELTTEIKMVTENKRK